MSKLISFVGNTEVRATIRNANDTFVNLPLLTTQHLEGRARYVLHKHLRHGLYSSSSNVFGVRALFDGRLGGGTRLSLRVHFGELNLLYGDLLLHPVPLIRTVTPSDAFSSHYGDIPRVTRPSTPSMWRFLEANEW